MRVVTIAENSSYSLNDDDIPGFREFLSINSKLPVKLDDSTLSFADYTIGSITVQDLSIIIQPRIKRLTPNHYFEMQLYNEGLLNTELSSMLGENSHYGIQHNLIQLFLEEAYQLVLIGVEGSFERVVEESNVVKGRILPEQISPINLLRDRIPVEYEIHTLSTSSNKIIKLTLEKVLPLLEGTYQDKLYALVGAYFEDIDVVPSELPLLTIDCKSKIFFENERYPTVLGLALKILEELKLNMKSNRILGSSYLVNSNELFEAYTRKVLSKGLKLPITKWDNPRQFGQFTVGTVNVIKSYVPDIIVDFHYDTKSALAVLDAKNKDISNPQEIGNTADLYQILFYCYNLDTTYGGLVYPSFGEMSAVRISIESFRDNNLYAFSIDSVSSVEPSSMQSTSISSSDCERTLSRHSSKYLSAL